MSSRPDWCPPGPGDRIKTDPRDARKLAGGLLDAITIPREQVEALRDLVRAREDARIDRMRDRHRMSKFLLRHGLRRPNKSWGATRRKWLGSLTFEYAHQQQAFQTYLHALDLVDRRIEQLRSRRPATATCGGCSSRRHGISACVPASARRSPPVSATKTHSCSSVPGALSNACTAAGAGWPRAWQAAPEDRRRDRPRARRLRLGDRDRPATDHHLRRPPTTRPSWAEAADAPNHTENPRRFYAALPASDPRP